MVIVNGYSSGPHIDKEPPEKSESLRVLSRSRCFFRHVDSRANTKAAALEAFHIYVYTYTGMITEAFSKDLK